MTVIRYTVEVRDRLWRRKSKAGARLQGSQGPRSVTARVGTCTTVLVVGATKSGTLRRPMARRDDVPSSSPRSSRFQVRESRDTTWGAIARCNTSHDGAGKMEQCACRIPRYEYLY